MRLACPIRFLFYSYFPNTAYAQWVKKLDALDPDASTSRFTGPIVPIVLSWIVTTTGKMGTFMSTKDVRKEIGDKVGAEQSGDSGGGRAAASSSSTTTTTIACRGIGLPAVKALRAAMNSIVPEFNGGAPSPWEDLQAKIVYGHINDNYSTRNPTEDFDPAVYLIPLLNACQNMPFWSPGRFAERRFKIKKSLRLLTLLSANPNAAERAQAKTMFLFAIYFGSRAQALGHAVPQIQDLRLPPQDSHPELWDQQGPKCIAIGFAKVPLSPKQSFQFLSNHIYLLLYRPLSRVMQVVKKDTSKVQDRDMLYKLIWRNPYRSDTCLLTHLLLVLHLLGGLETRKGPIFGNIDPHTGKMFVADHEVSPQARPPSTLFCLLFLAFTFHCALCASHSSARPHIRKKATNSSKFGSMRTESG